MRGCITLASVLNKIVTHILKAGVSQAVLAARVGCAQSTISRLASGKQSGADFLVADALRREHAAVSRRRRRRASTK
jgi:transcriptional regulator with XRE-family HTH domain